MPRFPLGWCSAVVWIASLASAALKPEAEITRVWPEKLSYRTNENARLTISVQSNAATETKARLTCELLSSLDRSRTIYEADLTLVAGEKREVEATWNTRKEEWGFEAVATLKRGREVLDRKREVFGVADNPWKITQYSGGLWSHGLNVPWMVSFWRNDYSVVAEWFSAFMGQFSYLAPKEDGWVSAGAYREEKATLRSLIVEAHKQGLRVLSYGQAFDLGPPGFEFARKHPEWVACKQDGQWQAEWDVSKLDKLEDDAYKFRLRSEADRKDSDREVLWMPVQYNFTDPKLVTIGAQAILESVRMFGWDGFRWDSVPYVYPGTLNSRGEPAGGGKDLDSLNARNIRLLRLEIQRGKPDFTFGWNYGIRYAAAAGRYPKAWKEQCKDSLMLLEETVDAWNPNNPYHNWASFARIVKDESRYPLEGGGHYFIHICRAMVIRTPVAYTTMATIGFASRAHLSALSEVDHNPPTQESISRLNSFALRYSRVLYDPTLRDITEPEKAITVSAPVWWKDYVYERIGDSGRPQWVLHLINPPAKPVPEGQDNTPPEVREKLVVTLQPPKGREATKVWLLSPDDTPWQTELKPSTSPDGILTVSVPRLKFYDIVVAEW